MFYIHLFSALVFMHHFCLYFCDIDYAGYICCNLWSRQYGAFAICIIDCHAMPKSPSTPDSIHHDEASKKVKVDIRLAEGRYQRRLTRSSIISLFGRSRHGCITSLDKCDARPLCFAAAADKVFLAGLARQWPHCKRRASTFVSRKFIASGLLTVGSAWPTNCDIVVAAGKR